MDIVHPEIESYLEDFVQETDPLHDELLSHAEKTRFRTEDGRSISFPIVGPLVGRVLMQLALLSRAKRVFEFGSGFGYSAYWFARGIGPEGEIVLTDGSEDNILNARKWLGRMPDAPLFRFKTGDALKIFDKVEGLFDIVFIDCDKRKYPEAFRKALPRVAPGGMVVADNVLWSGEVTRPAEADEETRAILEFTRLVRNDPRLVPNILPVRDGLCVAVKAR